MSTDRSGHVVRDDDALAHACRILDVEPGVDAVTLRRAYRRRLLFAHPDHGGSRADLAVVQRAYRLLSALPAADAGDPGQPSPVATANGEPPRRRSAHERGPQSSARLAYQATQTSLDRPSRPRRSAGPTERRPATSPSLFRRLLERELRGIEVRGA